MYYLLTPLAPICLSKHYTSMYRSLPIQDPTNIFRTDMEINGNNQL